MYVKQQKLAFFAIFWRFNGGFVVVFMWFQASFSMFITAPFKEDIGNDMGLYISENIAGLSMW